MADLNVVSPLFYIQIAKPRIYPNPQPINPLPVFEELASCNDFGERHLVIMKCNNGNILVGGEYNQLMIFDLHLNYIKPIHI